MKSLESCQSNGVAGEELGDKLPVRWPPILHDSLSQEFWAHAVVNDLLAALNHYVPRDFPLEMNGRADGLCFAPFLCAHRWLGCALERLKELLEPMGPIFQASWTA